jgi:uncharacterized membrane protein YesL
MLFRRDYATPGPGIDPDAPEKTGPARMLEILQLECVDLVKLNLLFLLSCIPVVTLPPALFALNRVVRRMILDEPVDWLYHYRISFRGAWKRGYAAFLVTALPLVCAGGAAWFYLNRAAEQPLFLLPFALCFMISLTVLLSSPYLYTLLTTDLPFRQALRTALVLGLGRPLRGALAALCVYGLTAAAVLALPISLPYLALIGFTLPCLLGQFFVRTELNACRME